MILSFVMFSQGYVMAVHKVLKYECCQNKLKYVWHNYGRLVVKQIKQLYACKYYLFI